MDHECIQKHTIEKIEEQLKDTKNLALQIPLLIQRIDLFLEGQKEIKDELEYQKDTTCTKDSLKTLDDKVDKFIDIRTAVSFGTIVTLVGLGFQAGLSWYQINDLITFKNSVYAQSITEQMNNDNAPSIIGRSKTY